MIPKITLHYLKTKQNKNKISMVTVYLLDIWIKVRRDACPKNGGNKALTSVKLF